jgi:hypothetical protein
MATEKGYNGWSNYETWAVKLWIDNEEPSYNYWREQTKDAWELANEDRRYPSQTRKESAICILSGRLKDEHEENKPEVNGVFADLLSAALSEVDWYEIASAMVDDEAFPETEVA